MEEIFLKLCSTPAGSPCCKVSSLGFFVHLIGWFGFLFGFCLWGFFNLFFQTPSPLDYIPSIWLASEYSALFLFLEIFQSILMIEGLGLFILVPQPKVTPIPHVLQKILSHIFLLPILHTFSLTFSLFPNGYPLSHLNCHSQQREAGIPAAHYSREA